MTEQEFKETFGPMAMIHFRSIDGLRNVASGYYDEIRGFIRDVLYEVMIDLEREYDGKHFPGPAGLKELCRIKARTRILKRVDEFGGITDEEVNSPGNIAARKKFFLTLAGLHDKNGKSWNSGISNLAHCLGEAIIIGPLERARKDGERDALKKERLVTNWAPNECVDGF